MASSWPYAHSGLPNGSPMIRNTLGQYSSMTAPASYPSSALAAAPYSGPMHPMHSLPNTAYPYGPCRQSYPATYGQNFPDDMFQSYGLQQPSHYHQTAHESHLPSLDYLSPEISRQWTPVAVDGRQSHQYFNSDQESSSRFAQPHYSQTNISVSTGTPNAPSGPIFPGLASLKNSLPSLASHRSRTLPVPESQRTSVSHSTNNISSIPGESALPGVPQAFNYRSSIAWNAENAATETNEAASSSASSKVSGTGPTSSNSSSSPQATHKSTAFGFQAVPSSPSGRDVYYAPTSLATTMPATEGQLDQENASFHGRLSKDLKISNQHSTPGLYGYSLGSSTRNGTTSDQMIPDGTLVSGQLYTRLQEPHQSYDNLPALSGEASSHATHRTSISDLSNSRLY